MAIQSRGCSFAAATRTTHASPCTLPLGCCRSWHNEQLHGRRNRCPPTRARPDDDIRQYIAHTSTAQCTPTVMAKDISEAQT